jgi:glycerol-3-phosphate cytidylyltransferase
MRVVYTGGTFDLFHSGHVNFLRQCKEIAGKDDGWVVVSLNTDEFIKEFKGKPPVYSYNERKKILESCKYVDQVIKNTGGKDSKVAIEDYRQWTTLNYIVIGSDWANKDYYAQMGFTQDWLDARNIVLIYVPYTKGISTTELKKRIQDY